MQALGMNPDNLLMYWYIFTFLRVLKIHLLVSSKTHLQHSQTVVLELPSVSIITIIILG